VNEHKNVTNLKCWERNREGETNKMEKVRDSEKRRRRRKKLCVEKEENYDNK
jgi:hypothetical protein